jgi:hypothetical protein
LPSDASSGAEATKDTKPAADASTGPVGPPAAPTVDSTAKDIKPAALTLAANPVADTRPKPAKEDHPPVGTVIIPWAETEAIYDREAGKFIRQERQLVASDDEGAREWEYRDKPAVE